MSYPAPLAATLSGATVRQLAYWRKNVPGKGVLLEPEHGRRPRALYSYRDIVALRMFVQLRGEMSLQKLRKAAAWLVQHHPKMHLSSHRVKAVLGGKSAVWISPDGEYVDVVEHPGQSGFKVILDDLFGAFTTGSGREVPSLVKPTPGTSIDPAVRGGYPVLEGTRIPYNVVAALSLDGVTTDEIVELYPSVTPAEVEGARDLACLVAENARYSKSA